MLFDLNSCTINFLQIYNKNLDIKIYFQSQTTKFSFLDLFLKFNIKLITFVYTNKNIYYTFVPTNKEAMKIEEEIKSTVELSLAKKVILNLSFSRSVIADRFLEILKPFDLSSEQYNVLRILRGQKGKPANMSVIQERMISKNSNTTRLVDKLIVKEFVIRKICPSNKRKMEITITEKGLLILEKLDPIVIEHENNLASNLTTEELTQLNNLLEKYRN
jgi:DNA-binding MarR family transcriptional regulator